MKKPLLDQHQRSVIRMNLSEGKWCNLRLAELKMWSEFCGDGKNFKLDSAINTFLSSVVKKIFAIRRLAK